MRGDGHRGMVLSRIGTRSTLAEVPRCRGAGGGGADVENSGCLLAAVVLASVVSCTPTPAWRGQLEGIGVRFISARELKAMLDRREDFVLIDARDEIWYRAGRIPGAISIPAEDAPLAAVDVSRPKRLLFPERLPQDRGRLLVFYCGGPT